MAPILCAYIGPAIAHSRIAFLVLVGIVAAIVRRDGIHPTSLKRHPVCMAADRGEIHLIYVVGVS